MKILTYELLHFYRYVKWNGNAIIVEKQEGEEVLYDGPEGVAADVGAEVEGVSLVLLLPVALQEEGHHHLDQHEDDEEQQEVVDVGLGRGELIWREARVQSQLCVHPWNKSVRII